MGDKLGDNLGDTMENTVENTVADTVANKVAYKVVTNGKHRARHSGDKVPRFRNPAHTCQTREKSRYHPLL